MNSCFSTTKHKALNKLFFYIILLTLNGTAMSGPSCGLVSAIYKVQIINKLKNDPENNIRVQCASKDDDIGYGEIESDGGELPFKVCINIFWFTPVYKCHIQWGKKQLIAEVMNGEIKANDCRPDVRPEYDDDPRARGDICYSIVDESGLHIDDIERKPIPWG
ncbi:hypothetical protein CASFOL_037750 [Castilleja foliolosa]|uniref:S-protein homolog n=1 Tax=Castilleja foliolosa TaxID=1961234 RepID=A0ABD3BJI8_9LAMI